jgi:hypothetical protein
MHDSLGLNDMRPRALYIIAQLSKNSTISFFCSQLEDSVGKLKEFLPTLFRIYSTVIMDPHEMFYFSEAINNIIKAEPRALKDFNFTESNLKEFQTYSLSPYGPKALVYAAASGAIWGSIRSVIYCLSIFFS